MLIGIISDSHDDMQRIKQAVELFNGRGAGLVLHAGDVISPFTFEVLGDLKCPFSGVFGNNDGDRVLLKEKSGGKMHVQPLVVEIEGRRIAVVHEPASVEALARSGMYDLVVYGHTHRPDLRTLGSTLVLNPGKAARLHKGKSTVALLDTATMRVEIEELT